MSSHSIHSMYDTWHFLTPPRTGRGRRGWSAVRAEHKLQRENSAVLREGPVQPRLPPWQREVAGRRGGGVRLDDDSVGEENDDESRPCASRNT